MNLYNNTDNNINYQLIDLKLRKINDTVYDSIIKKPDGYYYKVMCGYKPYEDNHNYGEGNIIHNGLYMIYPLPQHQIKEFKLENFTPPKLLDGNSLITVDSFNSLNSSEFTIKVPMDRRYMAHKEYIEGKNILLEQREDRNHNKTIQVKEIYNDTNDLIGMQSNISLTNNKTETVVFYKKNEDNAKLKLLSIEGNTVQNNSKLANIDSVNQLINITTNSFIDIYNKSLVVGVRFLTVQDNKLIAGNTWAKGYLNYDLSNYQLKKIKISCYITKTTSAGFYFRGDTNIGSDLIAAQEGNFFDDSIPVNIKTKYEKILTIPVGAKYIHLEGHNCIYEDLQILLIQEEESQTIDCHQSLRAIKEYKDKLYLKNDKYFINQKIESINIKDFPVQGKTARTQTVKFYIDTNIKSIGSDVIGCISNNINCDAQDVSGMYMSEDVLGRIIISIPLSDLNNDPSDENIKQYFNDRNPEILFVRKKARTIVTDIESPILLSTVPNESYISINNNVKGVIDLDIHYDNYSAVLTVSKDENHTEKLIEKTVDLPRSLKPNEIYAWDNYRKHYTLKKNVVTEQYQNYTTNISLYEKNRYRYIRESMNGSSANAGNHWIEIEVYSDNENLCKKISPLLTSSSGHSSTNNGGNIKQLIDGNKSNYYEPGGNPAWVQIDLLQKYPIDQIKIWHYYQDGRTYNNVKLECSADGKTWDVIYNNENPYKETSEGKTYIMPSAFSHVENNKIKLEDKTNKILVTKQLINNYNIVFKNDQNVEISTEPISMKKIEGINTTAYFNIVDKPANAKQAVFDIELKDECDIDIPMAYENFALVAEFNGRINDRGVLVSDNTTKSYYLKVNTSESFDLFVKGGNILKIGCLQNAKADAEDGDVLIDVKDYSNHITEHGTYLRVNLKDLYPIKDTERIVVINTNGIGTVKTNPCTELFIIASNINYYENLVYDEIEYFTDENKIIEIEYQKIKDNEKAYSDTFIINDWIINNDGQIEKREDNKAYSALVLCKPKDSFKISGEVDSCSYVFLDENKEPITSSNGPNDIGREQEVVTTNAPKGTQYCLFYLNSQGILKEQDVNLILQSFSKSSEINHYIKMDGNPTLSISAPYKKVRPLDKPTNIVAIDQKTSLVITWDEVLGAEQYIVYLEGKVLETVTTNRLELLRELKGNISIRAINNLIQSPLSDNKYIHSVPRNPFIIYIDNIYQNDIYTFDVTFKDNSELETAYKLKYIVDDRGEETINLPGCEGTGTLVKESFSTVAINSRVRVRVLAVNEQGENEVAPYIEMRMPPDIKWTYKEDTHQLVVSWLNTFPESSMYLLRYKLEGAEHTSTQTILNEYTANSRITTYIPLEKNQNMIISLAATVREDLPHIFSKPIVCSAEKDVNLIAPTDFNSRKIENNQVEFSWTDNHEVEDGWELSVIFNNNNAQTIFIPSDSVQSIGTRKTYIYTFSDFGFLEAKLRMKWELGVSRYTEALTNYYFEVVNQPPSGIKRKYINPNMIKFEWIPQNYVDRYVISIKKKTESAFKTIRVLASEFYFEDFEEVDYVYNIKTEFLGEIVSEPTENFEFKPTILQNCNAINITNKDEKAYSLVEKTTTKIADKYGITTRSITQNTSIQYPVYMYSTTEFTMVKGLIAIETWGVGQRTEGPISSNIIASKVKFVDKALNTISYKQTTDLIPVTTTIVTPNTGSYKIEMEINKTRIVCFGDSITAGHPGYWAESGTGDIEHSYPYWLDRRLKFKYEVINKGYGSDRTTDLLNRIDKDVIALNPQYCLIQIGTNDIYWGAAGANGSLEAFEEVLTGMKNNIKTLVKKCMDNEIKPILGQLIPRTQSVTDELVKYGLYSFNEWIMEYANSTEGLNYVDFFNAGKDSIPPTPLEDPDSPGAMNPIYDGDNIYDEMGTLVQYGAGIHLNKEGYRIMAEAIPLNLFSDFSTGLKMYADKDCLSEVEYNTDDKQNPYYKITVEAMKLTRTKKIVRYVKNIGIGQTLFAMYPTKVHNLKYTFKTPDMENAEDTAYGILAPGKSIAVIIELTPQIEDSKSEFELSLVGREFLINS